MTKDELVIFPDLPPLPQNLIESDDFYTPTVVKIQSQRKTGCTKNGVEVAHAAYNRYEVSQKVKDWVHENITRDYNNIGYSVLEGTSCPHSDVSRDWTLIWLFETGGPDVETVFWRQEGQPYYPKTLETKQPTTYDNLIELCKCRLPKGQWVLLNAQCLHSVENVKDVHRKALQIGFLDNSPVIAKLKDSAQLLDSIAVN